MRKTIGPALCLMIALAASPVLAQTTTAPAATEPSGYGAVREIEIESRTSLLETEPVNLAHWSQELTAQAQKLAPQYLGISEAEAEHSAMIAPQSVTLPGGISVEGISLGVGVDPKTSPRAKPNAPALADELVRWLDKSIKEKVNEARRSLIDPIKNEIQDTQHRITQTREELNQLRDQIRQKTGRIEVSPDKLKEAGLAVDDQRQNLELSKLGKQARVKAIQDAVARLSKQVEQKVKDDPIAVELKKVVDARDVQVKHAQAMAKVGRAFSKEVEDAIAQAAEAKAKLLERQRESAADAGGGQIDSLNQELTTLNIDLAEIDAKLTALNQQRDGLQWALDHVDQFTQLSATLADEQKELSDAKQKLQQTQDQLDKTPPVTIRVVQSSNG